jgi:hypothetical protein
MTDTALDALRADCYGCGCLQFTHAHRAVCALSAVLALEVPQQHPAVHEAYAAGWDAAIQAVRDAITAALKDNR